MFAGGKRLSRRKGQELPASQRFASHSLSYGAGPGNAHLFKSPLRVNKQNKTGCLVSLCVLIFFFFLDSLTESSSCF